MRFRKLIRLFEDGNVCVCGLRGRGKDLLMSNVVTRRAKPYVSNVDYGGKFYPYEADKLSCGGNTFENFISGNLKYYSFPYPDGTDIYISDAGVYFPSQYCNELNRKYKEIPVFQALSRHVGLCNFHFNAQNINRVYDKIREQSDIYILCRKCWYIKGFIIQFITIYDKYDSAVSRIKPLRLPSQLFPNAEARMMKKIKMADFEAAHGTVQNRILIYRNKSTYDTRRFKSLLEEGIKNE